MAIRHADNHTSSDMCSLLTRCVIIALGNYAILSLVEMAFAVAQPLFFSTPIAFGGLGLSPLTIGKLLFIHTIINGAFLFFIFAQIHEFWGSKRAYQAGIASMFFAFGAFPLINYIAKTEGLSLSVQIIVGFQVVITTGTNVCYGKWI